MERLQLDFSVVQNSLFNIKLPFNRFSNDNMDVVRKESYFSEAALTRDSVGNCRFAFAMDYGKIIRDHTKYGSLYSKSNQEELFRNVRIKNMRVMRRRVTRSFVTLNQLGSPTHLRDVFDSDEPVDILCYTGETRPGKLKSVGTAKGSIREISFELDAEHDEVRHFMGVDRTMPTVTDGYWQYGIEIEVEDQTHNFIIKKLSSLARAKYWIDWYYNTAPLPSHFDVVSNRFTEEFAEKMYDEYGWDEGQTPLVKSPWIKPLITYLSTLSFFRKAPIDLKFAAAVGAHTLRTPG